jgi:hypothetical protein
MAGVLTLGQWLGGPDNVKVESTFPSSSRTYTYNFAQDITGWTFKLDAQTVIVNTITYDRTGEPNFANSEVIGFFTYTVVTTSSYIAVVNTASGIVNVTHPPNLYTGGIFPDARANVPLQVMGLTWTTPASGPTPAQINSHRIAKILAWEPQVPPTNPTLDAGYTSLV